MIEKYENVKFKPSTFDVSSGTFADGRAWRIQKVNGMYYFDVEALMDGMYTLVNVYRNFDLAPVIDVRNQQDYEISKRIDELKERNTL